MDPSRGIICRGPEGPLPDMLPHRDLGIKGLPSTSNLIQEENFLQFLASLQSREADDACVRSIGYGDYDEDAPEQVNRPTVFSTLIQTSIAVADNMWVSGKDNLIERTQLNNGSTSVFHAQGVPLEGNLMDFKLVLPRASLDGDINHSLSKCQLRRQQSIYLFVYPPPSDLRNGYTSSLHYWSLQKDGQSQLSPETCNDLGLPVNLDITVFGLDSSSWSTDSYKSLQHYQVSRGFDPTTTDFAQHLGYRHIFQPQNDDDWFEDACDRASTCPESDLDLHRFVIGVDPESLSTTQESEESPLYGRYIHINGSAPVFNTKADPNAANGRCWMSNARSGINDQGYLDQASHDDGEGLCQCNSYFGVEMPDTSDNLDPRNSQHTTTTASINHKSYRTTGWPATARSTPPESLEEAVDDYDSPFTNTCDPNIDELCGLFELLMFA
ncbi:hypothetical protein PQX77_000870 [Marasmius sp. AFHP31]|nr:hypothetical protein PQX77_000870 [Marasmius sp. AFHP31]